jgi:hypothetical protein
VQCAAKPKSTVLAGKLDDGHKSVGRGGDRSKSAATLFGADSDAENNNVDCLDASLQVRASAGAAISWCRMG